MNLEDARKDIDAIDKEIVDLLSKRISAVRVIARYKLKHNLDRKDETRENEIIEGKVKIGTEKGLEEKYITDIFKRIILESHNAEKKIMGR